MSCVQLGDYWSLFHMCCFFTRGADDRASYVNLLKELRMAFEGEAKSSGQPRLLLTAAVPASFEAIAAGYVDCLVL